MRTIRNSILLNLVVSCCLGAFDLAEAFQQARPISKTNPQKNLDEVPWSKKSRWNFNNSDESFEYNRLGRDSHRQMSSNIDGDGNGADSKNLLRFSLFAGVGALYWYLLVLGAAAKANGLPVPEFIPMVPGWPVSDADLAPVLEDSFHFFYLSDLLQNPDAPYVSPPRLAIFNLVEAWIFAMLPALWRDGNRRLPRPILLISWLALGINLTNAFLAPYLALTELRENENEEAPIEKNPIISGIFAAIAIAVVGHAATESITVATNTDWAEFIQLAKTDRSYLAFCIDPILFAVFQPLLLARIKKESDPQDYIPFVGLMIWLLSEEKEE